MSIGQQEVERIVSEVLSRLQGSAAAPCAASGGDFGLFDHLEDAVSAAEAAYPKVNTIAMREKVMNGLQPRNFVELPEFAAQPALSQRERPLPLNAATGRFPVPAPAAKRAQAKFSTGAISSPAAGPEMTFTRIGKKVE